MAWANYEFFPHYERKIDGAVVTATKYYFFGGQRIAQKVGTGALTYLHADHLGSVLATTGVTNSKRFYPYGATRTGTIPTDYGYTGQHNDGTGLLYYKARYYDPASGQFMSPDTIVPDPDNLFDYNRYMYGYGNPVKYSDPSGHVSESVHDGGGGTGTGYRIPLWPEMSLSEMQGEMLAWMQDHQDLNQILAMQAWLSGRFPEQGFVTSEFEAVFTNSAAGGSLPDLVEGDQWPAVAYLLGATFGAGGMTDAKYDNPMHLPTWSSSRRYSTTANAGKHWRDHGADFPEYQNAYQYVRGAQEFISNPPPTALTLVESGGNIRIFDQATNVYAVAQPDGTPLSFYVANPAVHKFPTNLDYFYRP